MQKIQRFYKKPDNSIIARDIQGDIQYIDSFRVPFKNKDDHSIDYVTTVLFSSFPAWVMTLSAVRNLLVKPFGLETGRFSVQKDANPSVHYYIGDKAVLFTVIDRSQSEIVMDKDDNHLYFRTSVHVEKTSEKNMGSSLF